MKTITNIHDVLAEAYENNTGFHLSTDEETDGLPVLPDYKCYITMNTKDIPLATDYFAHAGYDVDTILSLFEERLEEVDPDFIFEFYCYQVDEETNDVEGIFIKRQHPCTFAYSSPEDFAERILAYLDEYIGRFTPVYDEENKTKEYLLSQVTKSNKRQIRHFNQLTKSYDASLEDAALATEKMLKEKYGRDYKVSQLTRSDNGLINMKLSLNVVEY